MKMDKQIDINNKKSVINNGNGYDMLKIAQSIADYDIVYNNLHKEDLVKPLENINQIIYGENLKVLIKIPSNSVHLVYLDPPFFSGSNYQVEVKNGKHKQIVKFEDEWNCDENEYILRMYQRLKELHRILKPDGVICLHCDRHAVDWLKIIMDKIFGLKNYQTRIVWQRTTTAFGAKRNKIFPEMTDYILVYSKGKDYTYNMQYTPHTKEFESKFINPDNDPNGRHAWQRYPEMDSIPSDISLRLNEQSEVKFLKQLSSGKWTYKRYWNDTQQGNKFIKGMGAGKPIMNVWTDIKNLHDSDYPTQKPEALLERIILSFSNPSNMVLDPFCGGGTSVAMAIKHKRNFIGIDQSPTATNMSADRVSQYDISPIIPTREQTEMDDVNLMTPWIFQEWGIDKVWGITTNPNPGKPSGGDDGIDGYVSLPPLKYPDNQFQEKENKILRNKWHGVPISVEKRIVSENDIDSFRGAMKRHNKKLGIFIAIGYTHTKEKIVKHDDMEVVLLTAEDLCKVDKYNFEA